VDEAILSHLGGSNAEINVANRILISPEHVMWFEEVAA
jgi:hypothetical protein